jgi:hypothetical protein
MPSTESLLALLRQWMTPPRPEGQAPDVPGPAGPSMLAALARGPLKGREGLEAPTIHSPYPFKNPITPTKEIDESLRRIRSAVPGAGTNVREIRTQPQGVVIKQVARDDPRYLNGPDLDNQKFLGAYPTVGPDVGTIYLNPRGSDYKVPEIAQDERDRMLAHELVHAAGHPDNRAYPISDKYVEYRERQPEPQTMLDVLTRAAIGARK